MMADTKNVGVYRAYGRVEYRFIPVYEKYKLPPSNKAV